MGQRDSLTQQQPSVLRPIAFGLIGAPVGLVAGAFVGGVLAISAVEDRELGEAVFWGTLGFAAGAVLGEPWGSHAVSISAIGGMETPCWMWSPRRQCSQRG